ncbi:MAG: 30S ribosomal protein S7 [SAR324 cluster bacterium]|uniref:Small ribosomal subunit protein uS7 n=1 Tax=SAR324 cluster bacterium TaxID=2024889 RepID=A0A7X9IIZ1_9DELT|nr:30S ribosomal protein S7 [SAR324 cluster bacterium]
MTRKKRDYTRDILPDPKFNDLVIAKLINKIMRSGKKSVAEKALYSALDVIGEKVTNEKPLDVFHKALGNIKPVIEVRSRRVGGATYQVPTEVRSERAESLAIRWLIGSANSRSERRISERLANELLDAFNNRGLAVKKREDTHKMAEANKAFAHFKW